MTLTLPACHDTPPSTLSRSPGFYAVASIGRVERTASTGAILSVPALGDEVLRVSRITDAMDTLQHCLRQLHDDEARGHAASPD